MGAAYNQVMEFRRKFPGGIAWRIKKHCAVIDKHLNKDEIILFAFAGQKNDSFTNIFDTCVVCLTNKRIIMGQKCLLWGYHLNSITPDLFNDLEVHQELIWGRIVIDTVKEVVVVSNIAKRGLAEIETNISTYMMKEKKKYGKKED